MNIFTLVLVCYAFEDTALYHSMIEHIFTNIIQIKTKTNYIYRKTDRQIYRMNKKKLGLVAFWSILVIFFFRTS